MSFGQFGRGEIAAAVGGLLLAISIFLPWYATSDNPNSQIDGARGALSAWAVHDILRWLLLAAAAAPIILLWIVFRDHELSWPRGEMTAVTAIAAFGLVGYSGVVDRPGNLEISLQYGWFMAMVGVILMAAGGAHRASSVERPRRPPGVLR
jgi:hypothetical protein